jgi:hypothetical protein
MRTIKLLLLSATALIAVMFCGSKAEDIGSIKKTIKEAYIFAYPMLENYKTMYVQAINTQDPAYKGPFNKFSHMTKLLDADFTAIVAPNNDTYYSFLWLDLRREPVVISIPPVPENRYFVLQFIDMFTHNFAYAGTRTTGNNGGKFLVAGPYWKGEKPEGIDEVFRSESQFNYVLGRILVRGKKDHDNAMKILNQYKTMPLSEYLGQTPPPEPAKVDFIPYDKKKANSIDFAGYFNFLMNFIEPHKADKKYYDGFAKYGLGKGKIFDKSKYSDKELAAMEEAVKEGHQAIVDKKKSLGKMVNGWSFVGSAFGPRESMQDRYLIRAAAAELGMYGNSPEEASNFSCALDAEGNALNASGGKVYTLRFEKGKLPPVNAFWSVTMYKLPEVLFVHNPINRYSISNRTEGVRFDKDGSFPIYISHKNPGKDKESNWLPAPDGPFILAMRVYYPKPEVWKGEWQPPAVKAVK